MFFKENKMLLLGSVGVCAIVLGVHFFWVRDNWAKAESAGKAAEEASIAWEKNFRPGDNLMPKPDAEKVLEDNNRLLKVGLTTLQGIEFGTKDTLQPYSEAAAGSGDRKNYLMTKQTNILSRAKTMNIIAPSELGLTEKISEDPVALNLLRVAIIDSFLSSCNVAKVHRLLRIQHFAPKILPLEGVELAEETKEKKPAKADQKKDKEDEGSPGQRSDRLVQFPVKVQLVAPEPALSRVLYEMQKPSDRTRGYLCLRGFHVAVRQAGSGTIEAVIAFTALLNEKLVRELGIPVKEEEQQNRGSGSEPRKVDLERY
ncbi:MAG TPA: hypothetical protein VEK08_10305 [Planctomycetota bacterium]|nr:hypothetical protein [Planctomycetota bacterium]